jgi:hypothetical protein
MNTMRILIQIVFSAAVVFGWLDLAGAQPVSGSASSVEWEAAHSPLIVRAVIEDVTPHTLPDGLAGGGGSFRRYQTVTVRVLETLKGKHSDRLQFVVNGDFGSFRLADLQKSKQEMLLFLETWLRSGKFNRSTGGYAYTRFPLVVCNAAVLAPKDSQWANSGMPVLASNLTLLSTPKQITDTIKAYLKNRNPDVPLQRATILLPPELRGGFYETRFTFPTDADLGDRKPDAAWAQKPVLDFEDFKKQFAGKPPAEKKSPYSREGRGYVGVYALEVMAADCDAIVRGVIEDCCCVSRSKYPTGDSYGVKVRVVETIKGKTTERIAFFLTDAGDLDRLQRDKQEVILFLRSNHNRAVPYPAGALGYRTRDGLWDDSAIVLDKDSAEVLFADLTWHRDPKEIVARLRAVAQRAEKIDPIDDWGSLYAHGRLPVFDVHPPTTVAAGSSIAGNQFAFVYLPVNQELEDNARKWAKSSNQDLRWLAARAMVYFKSDKNAELLKGMLGDDATWEGRDMLHMTGLAYPFEPEFLVRWEAFHVLAGWGYDVPQPVFTSGRRKDR